MYEARCVQGWHSADHARDLVCQHKLHNVGRVQMPFWFREYKGGPSYKRGKRLDDRGIKVNSVGENDNVLNTCNQENILERLAQMAITTTQTIGDQHIKLNLPMLKLLYKPRHQILKPR